METSTSFWEVTEAAPRIGSIIRADKATLLSGARARDIRELLARRGVLVFPAMGMSDAEQTAFAATLGTVVPVAENDAADGLPAPAGAAPFAPAAMPATMPATMDERINPMAGYLKDSTFWQIDDTISPVPIRASLVSIRRLSPIGGQTEFCSTYAAWDDLPEAEQQEVAAFQVIHASWRTQMYHSPEPSLEDFKAWQARGTTTLPLVWNHLSGRKSLILGSTALQIIGLNFADSEELLACLRKWATQPQFVYSHDWTLGDMVLWDNTGTMHRGLPYDYNSGTLTFRNDLEGEEPFA